MKLGFLTAAFPDSTLEQVAQWGAESAFRRLKLLAGQWQGTRRYAGVTHIDVNALTKRKRARSVKCWMAMDCHLIPGLLPQSLHPDAEHRETVINHLKKVNRVQRCWKPPS